MLIEWQPAFVTGVPTIDADHRHIIEMINRIWGRIGGGIGLAEIEDMMLDYCNYCSRHFQAEENMMVEYRYPGIRQHRTCHKQMLDQFESLMLRLEVAKEISGEQVRGFVQTLADHIQSEDRLLAAFIRERRGA